MNAGRSAIDVDSVVNEALLMAARAVRMSLKNKVIIDVLRDQREFKAVELRVVAAEQLREIADEQMEASRRAAAQRRVSKIELPGRTYPDGRRVVEDEWQRRRPGLLRKISRVLRHEATVEATLQRLTIEARDAALDEIVDAALVGRVQADVVDLDLSLLGEEDRAEQREDLKRQLIDWQRSLHK